MEKINKLKKLFNKYDIDGYLIPKNDEFFGEYIPENKDRLRFISNFTGSYGFALILKDKNYLFVDGRYSIQAKIQSGKLFNVFVLPDSSPSKILLKKSLKIGYDPKLYTHKMLDVFFGKTNSKLISIQKNLIDSLIKNKTEKSKKFFILPKKSIGEDYKFKINKLIDTMKKTKVNFQFITATENVAWLLNIRGKDSNFTPIPNAFLTIDLEKKINFFCDLRKINLSFKKKFPLISFNDISYLDIFIEKIKNRRILVDTSTCSVHFENILKKNNKITSSLDPIYLLKSIKSKIEIKNIIKAHIYDGAALTKFLFWIQNNYKHKNINEIKAEEKLLSFRKKNKNFKFLSFPTISGSGPNGAIIHYKATLKSNRKLKKGDLYLVDSGGQYYYGTTDVTRTISLDNKSDRIKNIFTRVLKGNIAVASYKINKNTSGSQIDKVARQSLNKIKLDYAHGTGHGVGYFLNVHEGPHAISKNNKVNLREGMIISNEPGYYEKGKFGIRIENLIRIKKDKKRYAFDNLTMAPIDKSLIDKSILNDKEIKWLNNYHGKVFKNLKPFMNKSELLDLKQACSNI